MNRRTLLTSSVPACIAGLAGCSTTTGSTAEFESTVESFNETIPVYEEYEVRVNVENVGDERGSHHIQFAIGTRSRSRSVTLDPGESETVTFSHTFEEPGSHTVTVADKEQQVTVVNYIESFEEPILESAHDVMTSISTVTETQVREMTVYPDSVSPLSDDGSGGALTINEQSTTAYEFDEHELYSYILQDFGGASESDLEIEEWFVGGQLYTVEHTPGDGAEPTYERESVPFSDAQRTDPARVLVGADPGSHTETETQHIYRVDPNDEVAMKNFIDATVAESDLVSGYLDYIETFESEVRIDRETHRIQTIAVEATLVDEETGDTMGTIDLTLEYGAYNEPVEVHVPTDVKNRADNAET